MSKIDQLVKTIVKAIEERDKKKTKALDTVATVVRVDDDYAWVRLAGSDMETPVKQTISVKKGDKVQVRASKGKAWIVGNETAPPTDDTLAKKALQQADKAGNTARKASDMAIVADVMWYLASALDEGVTVEDEGWTKEPQEATVALPYLWCYHEYERGNGKKFTSDPVIIGHYTEGGAGVSSVEPQYYLSTSSTSTTGGSWGSSFTYLSGYYIWTREKITLTDGTITYSTPIYAQALTETCSLSYDAAQYFWTKSTGGTTAVPTGSYVTEVSKSSYQSSPSGAALLLRSAGIYLRNAATTVAQFLAAGVTLFDSSGNTLSSFLSDGIRIYSANDSSHPVAQFLSSGSVIGKDNSYHLDIGGGTLKFYSNSSTSTGYVKTSGDSGYLRIYGSGSVYYEPQSSKHYFSGATEVSGNLSTTSNLSAGGNASITGSLSANSVTIGGHSNAIGYTTEASSTSDLTTSTSWANITGAYVTLGAGTWVIEGMVTLVSASSSSSTPNPNVGVRINGSSAYTKGAQIVPALGAEQVIAVAIATVSSGTQTFYVQSKKSGGSVVVSGGIKAVRIA